jgi:hypothetical protein
VCAGCKQGVFTMVDPLYSQAAGRTCDQVLEQSPVCVNTTILVETGWVYS